MGEIIYARKSLQIVQNIIFLLRLIKVGVNQSKYNDIFDKMMLRMISNQLQSMHFSLSNRKRSAENIWLRYLLCGWISYYVPFVQLLRETFRG